MSGLLAAFAPAVPAAAGEPCGGTFDRHLGCWADWIGEGTVRVTLDRTLPFDGAADRREPFERTLSAHSERLLVEVPSRIHTGQGGTALLVLADRKGRLVADDAVIDPLKPGTVAELAAHGACHPKETGDLCARLGKGDSLTGADLVRLGLAGDLSRTDTVSGSGAGSSATPTGETAAGKQEQEQEQGQGQGQEQGQGQGQEQGQEQGQGPTQEQEQEQVTGNGGNTGPDPGTAPDPGDDAGWDTATAVLTVLCAVLVLLLGLLLFLIRRSARSVAVGALSRRSLAAQGVGAVPAAATPRPRTRPRTQMPDEATTRTRARMPDEATTRLRATPAPRSHGRHVGNVPGPARPAVVRTELHPQGYVEVEHVLYRAVWAEPGRPPPAPGGLVDVTEAGERDSDVLYAFPPTAGRHAKATRP
ncbi:hypothetical protein OG410_26505 [Streptomyces sp. NBC_00659]|uniref:hypothetical protein n=1 Tax=Streptomyces sp. NBC_00659 TaxID=2903669 RepID=UPI002E3547D2|nr:hypothetical protein [Streptomyces sp. NBC_00659]